MRLLAALDGAGISSFFLLLYWLMAGGGSTRYEVIVINNDKGIVNEQRINEGERLVNALEGLKYQNGNQMLRVRLLFNRAEAEQRLKNRDAAALMMIPENFTQQLYKKNLNWHVPAHFADVVYRGGVPIAENRVVHNWRKTFFVERHPSPDAFGDCDEQGNVFWSRIGRHCLRTHSFGYLIGSILLGGDCSIRAEKNEAGINRLVYSGIFHS